MQSKDQDLVTFFDNNQKLGRSWRVKINSKMNVSVMTTIWHIYPPNITTFQNDSNLSPKLWFYKDVNVKNEVMNSIYKSSTEFKEHRREFIKARLSTISTENLNKIEDDVSKEIKSNTRIKLM